MAIGEARKRLPLVRFKLDTCDDRSDPRLTRTCAETLEKNGSVVIVGSINSLCSLELPGFAAAKHLPVLSPISTATRLTKEARFNLNWFFRAALSDRYQMDTLAQWLVNFRNLQPDEVAFVYEDTNDFVQFSSNERVRVDRKDVYGGGLRGDFLDAEPWEAFTQRPIDIGISRGLSPDKDAQLVGLLRQVADHRSKGSNRPVRALGLLTLWSDARDIIAYVRK